MSNKPPPIPPEQRSNKGPGDNSDAPMRDPKAGAKKPPENLAEQGRQGNIHQNTTHQGHQQDR